MKLTMKNQFTFQEMSGWPEDPDVMTENEVKDMLRYWTDLVYLANEEKQYSGDLVYLEEFLKNLANGEIEYTEPKRKWDYSVQYDHFTSFSVFADSKTEADAKALAYWKAYRKELKDKMNFENERLVSHGDWAEINFDDTPWEFYKN